MNTDPSQPERPEVYLEALLVEQARLAGDVIEIGPDTWAIHGDIPVDGDVIISEFATSQEAHAALDRLTGSDGASL